MNEILDLKWDDVDLARKTLTIMKEQGEKNFAAE
jgi:hypothetical protein